MNLLALIVSVMSFTVTSKESVTADGVWPYSMEANYHCTYKKGQVLQGDTAVIAVSGLDNITIEKVEVEMRSNKSSGSGTFYVKVNGRDVAYKWIADLTDTLTTIDLGIAPQIGVNEIEVSLVGVTNSLYINKYTFRWSQGTTHTVTLNKGNETIDALSGAEIELPKMDDEGEWVFIGWTDRPFYVKNEPLQTLLPAGTYRPADDITLWAVYEYQPRWEDRIATDLQDGVYIYADASSGMAMQGSVWNKQTEADAINLNNRMQWYEVLFDEAGLATIRLLYVYGEEYIGFQGTKLVNKPSKWQVYHSGEQTAFYTMVNNKTYILWPDMLDEATGTYGAQLIEGNNLTETPTVLLATDETITMTCYPEIGFDIETVNGDERTAKGEWIIPLGNYRLIIKDGKKQLEVW